jgi:nucleotide-binding universal stress UspA family protein
MKSIIVPVNFSPNAANAARYAVDMALALEADVYLFHALQMPVTASELPLPDYAFEEMQKGGQELLENLSQELRVRSQNQVKITTDMEIGGLEPKLEDYCERHRPFVVVMGASGSGTELLFPGNQAVRAIKKLHYPLLVIPSNASFHAIRKIVLACDLNDIGNGFPAPLSFLQELARVFNARFEVITVVTNTEQREGQAVFQFDSWKQQLQELYPELHFIHTGQNVEEGIRRYLGEHEADWLMVFPKKHIWYEFHRSNAGKIARDCPVPVISLHE